MKLIEKAVSSIAAPDPDAYKRAAVRCDSLIKPPGSLGALEDIAARICAVTGRARPSVGKKAVVIFAGDHGIEAEGVSAFPKEVTRQMVGNFLSGGAAASVLARHAGADIFVVDAGVDFDFPRSSGVISKKVAKGTRNFLKSPAMTKKQAAAAVEAGIEVAFDLADKGCQMAAPGDMGIANTSAAAAVVCATFGVSPEQIVGAGAGLSRPGVEKKTRVVARALKKHFPSGSPAPAMDVLAKVGGFEIGAIAGMAIGLAARRIPVVVDGFISTAGMCLALGIAPAARDYLFFSHKSSERGHAKTLNLLGARARMDFGMRLGEGTGALIMFSVIEGAVKLFNRMATFESAGVSKG